MASGFALAVLLALGAPVVLAPFPAGTWFGQGQPHDRSEMWVARMAPDGQFRAHFRTCRKGKTFDQIETGRWKLEGGLETIDIATVNGAPLPRHDQYRILHQGANSQTYRYLRTGFVFTSHRVGDDYKMPRCDLVS